MTPPAPESSERRVMNERRASLERRVGDRRYRYMVVPMERRRSRERRGTVDRRESADGHVRNAVQMLEGLLGEQSLSAEMDHAVRKAIERLWLGLREVERLADARRALGGFIRRVEPEVDLPLIR